MIPSPGKTTAEHSRFDLFSPPILLGVVYFAIYAVGALDVILESIFPSLAMYRLRWKFHGFQGLSVMALLHLLTGYIMFVSGYALPIGRGIAELIPRRFSRLSAGRASGTTVIMFTGTFIILVLYTLTQGYGRFEGAGQRWLENLSLLGEMSLVFYSLGLYRFMLARKSSDNPMSKWDIFFLWGIMAPLQIAISLLIGSRMRTLNLIFMALVAYHYAYKRLTFRFVFALACLIIIIMPTMGLLRESPERRPELTLSYPWETVMGRTSSLEGFTVTFEDLDGAPEPEPFISVITTGLIPRFVWPNKPQSTFAYRFSLWATGKPLALANPSMPGELILLFGQWGGLVAMFGLGIFWKALFELFAGSETNSRSCGFIYPLLLPALLTVEAGFIGPYSVLFRFLAIGTIVFWIVRSMPKVRRRYFQEYREVKLRR